MNKITAHKIILVATLSIFALLSFGLSRVQAASAGFGASPSAIKNEFLTRGSSYTETITVSRTDASADAIVRFEIESPTLIKWATFSGGEKMMMSKGVHRIEQKITIAIPTDAAFKSYDGELRVVLESASKGQVNVLPGVKLAMLFSVSDRKVENLTVQYFKFAASLEGQPYTAMIKIANEGNVALAPDSVTIRLFDTKRNLLRTLTETNLAAIAPFTSEEIPVQFTDAEPLLAGEYIGEVVIEKGNKAIFTDTVSLVVFDKDAQIQNNGNGVKPGASLQQNSFMLVLIALLVLIVLLLVAAVVGIWYVFVKKNKHDEDQQSE